MTYERFEELAKKPTYVVARNASSVNTNKANSLLESELTSFWIPGRLSRVSDAIIVKVTAAMTPTTTTGEPTDFLGDIGFVIATGSIVVNVMVGGLYVRARRR